MTNTQLSESIGIVVKKRLIELGMTQCELAQNIGVSYKYLNSILNGVRAGTKHRNAILRELGINEKQVRKGAGKFVLK